MKKFIRSCLPVADIFLLPFIYVAAWLLKSARRAGFNRLKRCKNALLHVGVFPIRAHYYEPQFDFRISATAFSQDRSLSGINWNVGKQLELLSRFSFVHELEDIPQSKTGSTEFYLNNGSYGSGDAEYWYQMIRTVKPRRIYEIGSGHSTLMAIKAVKKNIEQDNTYTCEHICIEPYEMPWLEHTGVSVIRQKVEDVDLALFSKLEENDVLFIDSSHMIRPQGDVLFEYLEILPSLPKGVIVHIHDIFSPKNYPRTWLEDEVLFWNEQYLLEAFLSHNNSWEIIGSLNYLTHHHYDSLKSVAPWLTPDREPGAFYIRRTA